MAAQTVDVLVVGSGPTGLTLAAQLVAHGVRPRLVDRASDRVHESRALAIQPRTLEVLAGLGITDELVEYGNRAVRLRLHARGREVTVPLFDLGLADTAYPYLLFLSQPRPSASSATTSLANTLRLNAVSSSSSSSPGRTRF